MRPWEKVVKYLAIAFAVFLIVSIITGIIGALAGLTFVFDKKKTVSVETTSYEIDGDYDDLVLDIKAADLIIESGTEFTFETNNEYIQIEEAGNSLNIIEDRDDFINFDNDMVVILTIPENYEFENVSINTGAGVVGIDNINAKELELELGAGEVVIEELNVKDEAKITGGAGEFIIADGTINDLIFDMGVGEVNLTNALTGDCELNMGVGETNLNLLGDKDDYTISIEKGVGSATLDGKTMENDTTYGSGDNSIEIDGGVGAIHISYK